MKTVIMAGGRGTRLDMFTSDVPKPLVKIEGIPSLQRELEVLREQGFDDIIITVSYLADKIIDFFGDGSRFGVNIEYYIEEKPMGNAGALFKIKDKLSCDFLLLNADIVFNVDLNRLIKFHQNAGAAATILTHPNNHPYDSGLIVSDSKGCVLEWISKEEYRPKWYKNRVNAGIHVLNSRIFEELNTYYSRNKDVITFKVDLDREVLKPLCHLRELYCYDSPEYVKDMGTLDRYNEVSEDIRQGLVNSKSLKSKQKAIFLDRDGTINKYKGFITDINQFELIPNVADAIKRINKAGYLVIVITNQPVIARGEISEDELRNIHNKMETLLGEEGAYIDGLYYCPHHPDIGYEGEIKELKIDCDCRKPKPGMLFDAANDFNIDLSQSWMIGDSKNDICAGISAGCKTALIGNDYYNQDKTVQSLYDFVNNVLNI